MKLKESIQGIDKTVRSLAEASLNDDKKAEERVCQFKDIVKQQLAEKVQTRVDDTVRKELFRQVGGELDDVHRVVTESKEHAEQIKMEKMSKLTLNLGNVILFCTKYQKVLKY